MKSKVEITQEQANELLNILSDYPLPYRYSGIIILVQKWLAEKFNDEEGMNALNTSTIKK